MNLNIPLVKIRFEFRAEADIEIPDYSGSMLRGVFGRSLRQISCLSGKKDCLGCGLVKSCPYASIFESVEGKAGLHVNPYIIEPLNIGSHTIKQGEIYSFRQVFFGKSIHSLSFMILAWSKGMMKGMGKNKSKSTLIAVYQEFDDTETLLYNEDENHFEDLKNLYPLSIPEKVDQIKIKIETPMRIHLNNHPISQDEIKLSDFFVSLTRRLELMYRYHTTEECFFAHRDEIIKISQTLKEQERNLTWFDWQRWSGRQHSKIPLGGIVGEWSFCGDLDKLLPVLYVGQLLHVGKSAVMGMGKYKILKK